MKCPHCGEEHPNTAKYCMNTGKKIESSGDFVICQNPKCDYRQPLPANTKFCPNCSFELDGTCTESQSYESETSRSLRISDITLGETRLKDLEKIWHCHFDLVESDGEHLIYRPCGISSDLHLAVLSSISPIVCIMDYWKDKNFSSDWHEVLPIEDNDTLSDLQHRILKEKGQFSIKSNKAVFILKYRNWIGQVEFSNDNGTIDNIRIAYCPPCPNCHRTKSFQIEKLTDFNTYLRCQCCGSTVNFEDLFNDIIPCPNCGSLDIHDTSLFKNDYQCNVCNHLWRK